MRRYLLAVGVLLATAAGPVHANMLTNGDFSAGNSGFGSDYTFENFITDNTQYTVTAASNINNVNAFGDWTAVSTDPNSGDGNVLVVNGATSANNKFWFETVALIPDTFYTFSFFGVDVNATRASDAVLQPMINSIPLTSLVTNGTWQWFQVIFHSGPLTSATISLNDQNTDNLFNDFAIADVSFVTGIQVPETPTWAAMLIGFGTVGFLGYRRTAKPVAAAV
jgi:hypothetical protein